MGRVLAAFGAAIGWHLVFGLAAPLFLLMALGLVASALTSRGRQEGNAWLGLLLLPALATLFGVLAAPLRALIQLGLFAFEQHGGVAHPVWRAVLVNPWIDAYLGAAGLLMALVALSRLGGTWSKLQHVANLPTSKARSAAVGLVEVEGTARVAVGQFDAAIETRGPAYDWEHAIPATAMLYKGTAQASAGMQSSTCEFLRPFFVEDATGRILIDPRGARFGSFRTLYLFGEPPARLALSKDRLLDGDPVYVMGRVRPRSDAPSLAADAERVVLAAFPDGHRSSAPGWVGRVRAALSKRDVFLVSDTREAGVHRALGDSLLEAFMSELILFIAALWLCLTHAPFLRH